LYISRECGWVQSSSVPDFGLPFRQAGIPNGAAKHNTKPNPGLNSNPDPEPYSNSNSPKHQN